jgi:hypothetical protein
METATEPGGDVHEPRAGPVTTGLIEYLWAIRQWDEQVDAPCP